MKTTAIVTIFTLLVLATSIMPTAVGQYPYGGNNYYQSRAATPAESYARGYSDVIRSKGEANLNNSAAAINAEQARKANIENRSLWTNTYFEMRQANRAYTKAERGPPPTEAQAVRYAQQRAPARLNSVEMDPVTGGLEWPIALQAEKYAQLRTELSQLSTKRTAQHGTLNLADHTKFQQASAALLAMLQENVRDTPPSDYVNARKFVESLSYEANYPTG